MGVGFALGFDVVPAEIGDFDGRGSASGRWAEGMGGRGGAMGRWDSAVLIGARLLSFRA